MAKQHWKGSVLLAPVPPVLVSCGTMEHPNILTIAWTGVLNTHPPMVSISVRPTRYSYPILMEQREFVINLPTSAMCRETDFCGCRSGKDIDKFQACHFTPEPAQTVSAPLIAECPISLECKIQSTQLLGTHELMLAEITAVNVEERYVDSKGKLNLQQMGLLAYAHGEYFSLGRKSPLRIKNNVPLRKRDSMMTDRLKQQLDFILEIDQEKNILRQTHLSHHGRRENDAEHAWHMTIMAYLLKEYANEPIDIAKVMMMCLLHDVVEIDAGDTYAYDEAGKQTQQAREAAAKERIYSLLPDDQKQELQALFDEFEARQTPESKFARAMDNLQPLLLNDSNQGNDWKEHTVTAKQVYQRQNQTKDGSEVLFDLTDQILQKNIADGNLPDTTPKIS